MNVRIACQDANVTRRLRIALQQMGIEWSDFADALESRAADGAASDCVVLFGSSTFDTDELSRLNDLIQTCDAETRFVAVGPSPEPSMLIELMQAGVSGFVDSTTQLEAELGRQFERMSAGRSSKSRLGKLTVVIPSSGGCGASFLATNIAAGMTVRQQSCCLLDLKSRGGDLATILGLTPRHTAASLAAKSDQIDRAMFEQSLVAHECGLKLLAGSDAFGEPSVLSMPVIQRILQVARSRFSHVVAELDAIHEVDMLKMLATCDRIVLPFRLDFTALRRTKKLLDRFDQAKLPSSAVTIVATRCGEPMELPVHSANESLSVPIAFQIPYAPAMIHESINLGQPLIITAPNSKVGSILMRLVDSIVMKPDQTRPKSRSILSLFRSPARS